MPARVDRLMFKIVDCLLRQKHDHNIFVISTTIRVNERVQKDGYRVVIDFSTYHRMAAQREQISMKVNESIILIFSSFLHKLIKNNVKLWIIA